jgi:hypothetical protein
MTLEEYFDKKNIDWERLARSQEELWRALKLEFEQMHPKSFEMRKKFILNKIRRNYTKVV